MTNINQFKRALALSTALSVVALGATTTAAEASNPGNGNGQGQTKSQSTDKSQGKATGQDKKSSPSQGKSGQGNSSQDKAPETKDPKEPKAPETKDPKEPKAPETKGPKGGDPAGNNGTVKITPHGELDGIPQNTPHVGCDFDIEWYGFDEGDDIISTVTFEAWAPTRGTLEVVKGDLSVFVGADPASGAGVGSDEDGPDADNGFDGEEHYQLAFPGIEPHPKQGYHVKLTINTPGSQGADVKHKVFWVQGCDDTDIGGEEGTPENPDVETPDVETPDVETPDVETPDVETPEVEGEEGTDDESDNDDNGSEVDVLGAQGNDAQLSGAQSASTLPTAVNAGLQAAKWVATPTPTPLYVALFGAILAGLGLMIRRRIS